MLTSSRPAIDQWIDCVEKVQSLDPLSFDKTIADLHELNRKKDLKAIEQMLYNHLPVPDRLDAFSYEESLAAMRDLGIFIGILKRWGVEPVESIPELEYVLLVLQVKTSLPPRDTLIHYTMWNPDGERTRSYTGLHDEIHLINSVKIAYPSLLKSIGILEQLHTEEVESELFSNLCDEVHDLMSAMVNGVVHAKRNVSPALFANELRFYFEPIKVDYNKEYIGPGAVEMPMFVFDHLLWSSDITDKSYNTFKETYLDYNLPLIRDIYWNQAGRSSLVTRVTKSLDANPTSGMIKSAESVQKLYTILKSFRMPHRKLANDSYRQGEEHHKKNGSGGYEVGILDFILQLQALRFEPLQEVLLNSKPIMVLK